ncbi:MAG: flagellar motor switch protein FliN [Rhodobacteraceae bacterium]|nr:MAG: flagellar motor switch protein FliN [Paracoccaceae bacterium]
MEGILPEIEPSNDDPATATAGVSTDETKTSKSIDAMLNVGMNVQIVLGYSKMPISDLLTLSRGSVIELDKKIGEPVDLIINQSLVARGDLIKVGENRIGISLTEIVKDYIIES